MKRLVAACLILGVSLAAGCATVEEDQFKLLKAQVYQNRADIKELDRRIKAIRRPQAEIRAEIISLRQDLARVRGLVEETGHQLSTMPNPQAVAQEVEQKQAEERKQLLARIQRLEAMLGIKPGQAAAATSATPAAKPAAAQPAKPTPPAAPAAPAAPQTAKDFYNLGHRLYKQKAYQAARGRWQALLKKFPRSRLASSAQFWIGESYYAQKRYEEAILAYNLVVKRYRKSSKAPAALLKQGLAFKALGDKRTARIVLNKLIKSYPRSKQAKTAKRLLKRLK